MLPRSRRLVVDQQQQKQDRPWRSSALSLVPRRDVRRAIFLLLALLAVLALKRSEGCSLSAMFETLSPPPATKSGAGDRVYQLRVDPPNPGR